MKRAAKVINAPVPVSVAPGMSPLLRWTLAASVGVHLIVLSLHFELPKLFKAPAVSPPLEVSLVNAKTTSKPSQSDFLAQANLDGGGNTDARRRLSSPLPRAAMDAQQTQLAAAREQVEALERQTRELLQQLKSRSQTNTDREAKESNKVDAANAYRELSAKALELQRLEAQIAREFDSYQQRPKKKHIGARATEYRFARYVEDWRQKVERVGNANYPEVPTLAEQGLKLESNSWNGVLAPRGTPDAVVQRLNADINAALSFVVVAAALSLAVHLAVDLISFALDPRLRLT